MQRVRRMAVLAVLTLAGALALTGCRSEPGIAIYVANARYSQQQVDEFADELAEIPGQSPGTSRQLIVQLLVQRDISKRLASAQRWDAPQIDTETLTGQVRDGLLQTKQQEAATKGNANPTDINQDVARTLERMRPLLQLVAESSAYSQLAEQHATPAKPTDADYAELYERAKVAGLVEKGQSESAYRQSLGDQNEQLLATRIGLRNMYADEIKRANVSINPKYGPAELPLLQDSEQHRLIVMPLDAKGGSAPVRDS
jgi:hypothetical protein